MVNAFPKLFSYISYPSLASLRARPSIIRFPGFRLPPLRSPAPLRAPSCLRYVLKTKNRGMEFLDRWMRNFIQRNSLQFYFFRVKPDVRGERLHWLYWNERGKERFIGHRRLYRSSTEMRTKKQTGNVFVG